MGIYKSTKGKKVILSLYEKQLKRIKGKYEDIYIDTSFGKTHLIETGNLSGSPLLVFHGGNATTAYNLLACDFLMKDFHIYAVDTIGHPGKSAEVSLSHQNNDYGKWAAEVIEKLGYESISCFGGSFGAGIIAKTMNAMIMLASRRPIKSIDSTVIDYVVEITGTDRVLVENTLLSAYPHGLIGGFLANYYEMAFKGTEEAVDFEKATTDLFRDVFGYKSIHLGQTGSKSAPDILLMSDSEGYQAIIDNKAYSKYSITGDQHNRMVHNHIEKISNYSDSNYPIGFFSYIAGGFISTFDKQIASEIEESKTNGSGITVATFIKTIEKNTENPYTHKQLRDVFSLGREVKLADI